MIDALKRGEASAAARGGAPPALFIHTSKRPYRSRTLSITLSISAASRTFSGSKNALRSACVI